MENLIKYHKEKYPLMELIDYIKLIFQNEFGAEHLVVDENKVIEFIKSEINNNSIYENYYFESIGNNLCRFHFNKLSDNEIEVLTKLFISTSKLHKGNKDSFLNKLDILKNTNKDYQDGINLYINEGIKAVHHSNIYRETYRPHYRVLKYEYGVYFNLISKINEFIKTKENVVIAIDGRCGSGKSKLIEMISQIYDVNIIHIDDYFIPMNQRKEDWKNIIAGNIDLERIEKEVLSNLKGKDSYISKKYNCQLNEYSDELAVNNKKITIIEGSYSLHENLDKYYDYKVFITCNHEIQKARIIKRNGDYYKVFKSTWIPMEEKYFKEMNIENKADIVIDNSEYF